MKFEKVKSFSILSVLSAILAVSLLVNSNFMTAVAQSDEDTNQENVLKLSNLIADGSPTLGDPNAPITIIDFSDFQCSMCARYVKSTEPIINENYVETGKANLIFKHFPIRGFDSMGASLAAQCLNDQGKFWEFHNMLYHNQGRIDSGWVNPENLNNFASQIEGINMKEFKSCFDSKKYKNHVENDLELAKKYEFKDSPSFIIVNSNGTDPEFLSGAHPFPSFASIIDKKLGNMN
ncbi:MAG: thioredoxin domain-containing protein [Nitrososphaeraceae archaeon]